MKKIIVFPLFLIFLMLCAPNALASREKTIEIFCIDSDYGKESSIYGEASLWHRNGLGDAVKGKTYRDTCTGIKNNFVKEYSCKNGKIKSKKLMCLNGCYNGVCITEPKEAKCEDSDGGRDYFTKGRVIISNGFSEDQCKNGLILLEKICSQKKRYILKNMHARRDTLALMGPAKPLSQSELKVYI